MRGRGSLTRRSTRPSSLGRQRVLCSEGRACKRWYRAGSHLPLQRCQCRRLTAPRSRRRRSPPSRRPGRRLTHPWRLRRPSARWSHFDFKTQACNSLLRANFCVHGSLLPEAASPSAPPGHAWQGQSNAPAAPALAPPAPPDAVSPPSPLLAPATTVTH